MAESPIVTVMTNLVEVFGKLEGRLPLAVQRQVRTLSRRVDLVALEPIFNRQGHFLPDVLMPSVAGRATLAEELERILADPQHVAAEIGLTHQDRPPDYFRPWLQYPAKSVERYVRALRCYHEVVISTIYPGLDERLRREAAVLNRAIDSGQGWRLLPRLHPRYTLAANGRVRYDSPLAGGGRDVRVHANQIVLVPMVSDPRTISSNVYGRYQAPVHLRYASPNLAVFAEHARPPGTADPLAALVGPSPARILRHLRLAATTTELANDLGLAVSTVSHHLQTLLASETVHAHRHGRAVYYRLTDRGHHLVRLYGTPP